MHSRRFFQAGYFRFMEAKFGKERDAQVERNEDANRVLKLPELEKRFDLSL